MASNFVMHQGVKVMEGTKAFELLNSKNPEDRKKADRLMAFCRKAEACGYVYEEVAKLRQEYADVV